MSEREPVDFHEQLPPPSPLAARKEIPSITSIVPEKQNAIEVPDVSQAVKGIDFLFNKGLKSSHNRFNNIYI